MVMWERQDSEDKEKDKLSSWRKEDPGTFLCEQNGNVHIAK
jgi:hypothetical protein